MNIKFKKLRPWSALPAYESRWASGMDLRADILKPVTLYPLARKPISTGVSVEIPPGFEGQIRPRSGLAAHHGVTVLNAPGTIDSDYRGELAVLLVNLGQHPKVINPGDRIAQLVIAPVVRCDVDEVAELTPTGRGEGGWGSTGR